MEHCDETPSVRSALNRAFLRHFLEMLMAMIVGMAALDEVAAIMLASLAGIDLFANPTLFAPVMTINMVIGMTVWMVYRRHTSRSIVEMSGSMFIPLCILIGPHWAGLVSGGMLLGGSMVLMLPVMVGVMLYRRGEYSMSHGQHHQHLTLTSP